MVIYIRFAQLDFFESLSLASLESVLLESLVSLASDLEESPLLSISLCQTDFKKPSLFWPSPESVPEGGLSMC